MPDSIEPLILDLLEWLAARDRSYREAIDAWRTSCPRLPVWETASERGLIRIDQTNGRSTVHVTPAGYTLLDHRKSLSK